jgi:SP family arabinose:H+ symporter-like MFS transporter
VSATATPKTTPGALNLYLLRSSLVAPLGGLLFGFDTAVIAGTTRALSDTFSLSPTMLGVTVSGALWGTVLGSLGAGPPSDRYGRRGCLNALGALYLASAVGCALAWSWAPLISFRFIGGLAIGASSVIGPMYIAEISPAARRGRLVGLFQMNVVIGILLAYFSNYLVSLGGFGSSEWRWKFGMVAIPAASFLVALCGIPQSPRWLVAVGRPEEARKVLQLVGEPNPDQELQEIAETLRTQRGVRREPLFQSRYRKPIFLATSISKLSSDMQAVAIGFTNLVFTIIAMSMIDRLGRKKLLLTGAVGTAVCLAGVAVIFATGSHPELLVWLLVGFIASFAFSQGAVIWVYLSEVLPNLVRAKGQSLGSFTHWFMNALMGFSLEEMEHHI